MTSLTNRMIHGMRLYNAVEYITAFTGRASSTGGSVTTQKLSTPLKRMIRVEARRTFLESCRWLEGIEPSAQSAILSGVESSLIIFAFGTIHCELGHDVAW